mgnify:CR=1 FL=1
MMVEIFSQQGHHHHLQGHTAARQGAHADIAAEPIGPAPVLQRGRRVDRIGQTRIRIAQQPQLDQQRAQQGDQAVCQHDHGSPAGHAAGQGPGLPGPNQTRCSGSIPVKRNCRRRAACLPASMGQALLNLNRACCET